MDTQAEGPASEATSVQSAAPASPGTDFSIFRPHPPAARLRDWMADTRRVTGAMLAGLAEADWLGPVLPTINPPQWELGHLAWFWEKWLLRAGDTRGHASTLMPGSDALYDSAAVPHHTRWRLPLPSVGATWDYLDAVLERVKERLASERLEGPGGDALAYFTQLCVFHQDMHNEAFAIRCQLLAHGAPVGVTPPVGEVPGPSADLAFATGTYVLGAQPAQGFFFDNEKWAHEVPLPAFAIAARPVTEGEFAAFIEAGGYAHSGYWSEGGWAWRAPAGVLAPSCWRRTAQGWEVREFERWRPLRAQAVLAHVNAHEAQAYCAWAGRRLPTEAEWERAWPGLQARGAVWEWTATAFTPYPGFAADPYADYSLPWFDGRHRVLRGGSRFTAPRNLWRGWRNFYLPRRADMFCGFRTCAL